MNILFLTDGITPFVTGGMQNHSLIMCKLLAKHNCSITLVHCGDGINGNFNDSFTSIFTSEELKFITPIFIAFPKSNGKPGHYIKQNKIYSQKIFNYFGINYAKFDLIYGQGFTAFSFLKNNNSIPVLSNLHGFEMFQQAANFKVKLQHLLLRPIATQIVDKSDYVLSFGGKIDSILKRLKVDDSKIIQQSNGIELEWINKAKLKNNTIKTFTFIGRFERRKGIEELTKAITELLKTDIQFKFNFIGPIPKNKQIQNLNIKYHGELKSIKKIQCLLDQSDFLISPSYAEGMSTVILEAMARGNAIIATDVGANSKLITDNGFFIDSSVASIKNGILKAIKYNDKDLLNFKENSIHNVKSKFTWEYIILQQLTEFKKIILKNKKE